MGDTISISAIWAALLTMSVSLVSGEELPAIDPLVRTVDLDIGEQAKIELSDGTSASVKLLAMNETRDSVRGALRRATVEVEVDGRRVELISATYHLPITVGGVQIDCPITKGHVQPGNNQWSLDADARLRLWPAGSPWIRPGTFSYPVNQRWFASHTLMANQLGDDERPDDKTFYYHWGLDFGGAERMVDVLAATDGIVVSAGDERLESMETPDIVHPRYDVVYLRDGRGWFYRYSHLDSIDPAVKPGERVKMGQKIGVLGKKGASGGWSHLHFDVGIPQPSGRYGITDGYAFVWQAYRQQYGIKLQAVARPHQLVWTDQPVTLDGSRSFSANGRDQLRFKWLLSDGSTATGPLLERCYATAGTYNEILEVSDSTGALDYDFALVQVIDRKQSPQQPPTIHAAYWPTFGIKPGDEVTFKVRSFRIGADDGEETWDFGDGTPEVTVKSDGNAIALAPDGYATTTHRFGKPGHYLVSVRRTNLRGETATARLQVRVGSKAGGEQ
jgi:murein DD-endopeptidase MepM/ murein hydrolase activator NlpD